MRNWLGQEIQVGSVVGRGARAGNSSDFKLGVVTKLAADGKVRVEWKFESWAIREKSLKGHYPGGAPYFEWEFWALVPSPRDSAGSPSVESLFVLTQDDLDRAGRMAEVASEWSQRRLNDDHMSKEEFLDRLESAYVG